MQPSCRVGACSSFPVTILRLKNDLSFLNSRETTENTLKKTAGHLCHILKKLKNIIRSTAPNQMTHVQLCDQPDCDCLKSVIL